MLTYGVYPKAATFPVNPFDVFRNEITIKGSVAQIHDSGRALTCLETGQVRVDEIVSDEFELKHRDRALENAWQRRGIKSVLLPPGS